MKLKGQQSLLSKLTVLFTLFTVFVVGIITPTIYYNQTRIYRLQQEQSLQNIAAYLSALLQTDDPDFQIYQEYFVRHCDEMEIPIDFNEKDAALAGENYKALFAAQYPGKVLGKDITFEELSPQVQMAYAIYAHEHYLLLFEKAREAFDIAYTYYIVPTEEHLHMCYVLDGVREEREGSQGLLNLGYDVFEPIEEHGKMWEAWDTGSIPSGYDVSDNEYGKTYAWYTPLYIGETKLGLIGTDEEIANFNHIIAENTARQMGAVVVLLILLEAALIWMINHFYLSRILHLSDCVERYAAQKRPEIASEIEERKDARDEISVLGNRIAEMILELDNYMNSLVSASEQLLITKTQVDVMSKMAHRDALTGIRNSTAYKEAMKKLEWEIRAGKDEFGIAVVDLNNLKNINDTYGHETGNIAIKRCCKLVCSTFCHSPVFRIGGDEFAIVLENEDYRNVEDLIEKFYRELEAIGNTPGLEVWERYSAAIGFARYDPSKDDSVKSVFRRADAEMYEKKKKMHAGRS